MSKKITNDRQDEYLRDIKTRLIRLTLSDDERSKFSELGTVTDDIEKKLKRALQQFDSSISIVIVVGMLKAGKSTLINLFARNTNASPVGFGIDTTLRPALIKMAEPGSAESGTIKLYFPRNIPTGKPQSKTFSNDAQDYEDEGETDRKKQHSEMLKQIIDELRGIEVDGKASNQYRCTPCGLDQANLRKALCEKKGSSSILPMEPLLVVVNLPYNSEAELLKDGNYLLDMPGLDSGNAKVSLSEGEYTQLVSECDMVLCLQSSVAPLNRNALCCFEEVLSTRSTATAWVVQNNMANKPWLTQKRIEQERKMQCDKAREVIGGLSKDVPIYPSNLGEAFAALLEKETFLRLGEKMPDGTEIKPGTDSMLYKNSGFGKLEKDMVDDIHKEGATTRLKHCIEELGKHIDISIGTLDEYKGKVDGKVAAYKNTQLVLNSILKVIDDEDSENRVFRYTAQVHFNVRELKSILQEKFVPAQRDEKVREEERVRKSGKKMKGSLIDAYVAACDESCLNAANKFLKEIRVRNLLVEGGDKDSPCYLKEKIEEEVRSVLDSLNSQLNKCDDLPDKEKGMLTDALKKYEGVDASETFSTAEVVVHQDDLSLHKKRRWYGAEKKFSNPSELIDRDKEEIISTYARKVEEIFRAGKTSWLNELLRKCVRNALQTAEATLKKIIKKVSADLERDVECQDKVNDMLEELSNIRSITGKLPEQTH